MLSTEEILILVYIGCTAFVLVLIIFLLTYVYLHQMKVNRFKLQLNDQEIKMQEELFLALSKGEEKERNRLAEELHDGISVKLSGLKMSVEYLVEYYSRPHPPLNEFSAQLQSTSTGGVNLLTKIAKGMDESIVELREISQNLKPSFLSTKNLRTILSDFIEHLNNKGQCNYRLYVEPGEQNFSGHIQVIYRIISELLNNIQKHANASQASAQVINTDGIIQIITEDNGKGFDKNIEGSGIGLMNIRSRLEVYNGRLNIDSTKAGTVIIVELPLCTPAVS